SAARCAPGVCFGSPAAFVFSPDVDDLVSPVLWSDLCSLKRVFVGRVASPVRDSLPRCSFDLLSLARVSGFPSLLLVSDLC
ncbi:MAG TPA: hypothetical protein VM715_15545, partial [Candidatus Acidoferrum sp.]|nr:hypothetical protein [Candidatus Acidoferrum sp.]